MSEWFHVGQNVVCVDDDRSGWRQHSLDGVPNWLSKGLVYTVRAVRPDTQYRSGRACGLLLEEVINPEVLWYRAEGPTEYTFAASRFRPCRKVDISIFTAMLNAPPRELVTAGSDDTRREGA